MFKINSQIDIKQTQGEVATNPQKQVFLVRIYSPNKENNFTYIWLPYLLKLIILAPEKAGFIKLLERTKF